MTAATPRPITPDERKETLERITGGWERILTDAIDVFDRPSFVAGNEARSPLAGVVRDLTRLNCRLWARADKSNLSPNVNAQNAEICGPYLDSIGESVTGAGLDTQFTGGQCVGTNYEVNFEIKIGATVANSGSPGGRYGPISREFVSLGGTSVGARINYRDALGNPRVQNVGNFFNPSSPPVWSRFIVTPISGPNNCGNPPVLYKAPDRVVGGTPPSNTINVNLPGVGPIGLTVTLDADGKPVVCIPALEVCATVDLPFRDTEPEPTSGGGSPAPGDIGSPGAASDVDGGESTEGEAGEGEVLTALKVGILETPASPKVFAPGVFRGVAYIYLGTADGLDHDPAGAMLRDGQLVLTEKENLTHWRVNANVGYKLRITPYYREATQ